MNDKNTGIFEKFEYWLTNRFWYYYKWYFMAGIAVLTIIVIWIVTLATRVKYDWSITYAHMGDSDLETAEQIKNYFKKNAVDVTGNRKVDIDIYEICYTQESEQRGENELYGALYGHDYYIIMMDTELFELYSQLGYFDNLSTDGEDIRGIYIDSLELYAAVNKGPALQYTLAQAEERGISEENLQLINQELLERHEFLGELAVDIVSSLDK